MADTQQLHELDPAQLQIINYPDPRLRQKCVPVTVFDDQLAAVAQRMLTLMRDARGVGLAAPQVGITQRLFVMNITGEDKDDFIFVNPVLRDREGNVEAEEGCLSLPEINVSVRRARQCRIEAQDLAGNPIALEGADLAARCWQHEVDHLDGVLIIDRMGPSDRIAPRKQLRTLEDEFQQRR